MGQLETFPMVPHMVRYIASTSVICFLALVLVGLRIYTRIITKAGVSWDDGFIVVSMTLGITLLSIEGLLSISGIGYHIDDVRVNEVFLVRMITVHNLVFVLTTLMNELSILCFYQRVFSTSSKMRIASRIFIGFFLLWAMLNIIELFVICHPDLSYFGHSCNRGSIMGQSSALSVFGDVVVLILPLPIIWKLNANLRTKIKITALFMFGISVLIIAILRYASILRQDFGSADFTISTQDSLGWAGLEPNMGILCASLPMVQNLFADWKEKLSRRINYTKASPQENKVISGGTRVTPTPLEDRRVQHF